MEHAEQSDAPVQVIHRHVGLVANARLFRRIFLFRSHQSHITLEKINETEIQWEQIDV